MDTKEEEGSGKKGERRVSLSLKVWLDVWKEDHVDESLYDTHLASDYNYLWRKKRLIHPDMPSKQAWDVFLYVLMFYSVSLLSPSRCFAWDECACESFTRSTCQI